MISSRIFRCVILLSVAVTHRGVRIDRKINHQTDVYFSDAIDPDSILTSVSSVDPEELLVGTMEGIAEFDFKGDIGEQTASLALATFGTALSMVNPILGVVFTVFSGLLGFGGADENNELIVKIKEMVQLMIKQSIAQWAVKLQRSFLAGILNEIKKPKTWADWQSIGDELSFRAPMIFNVSCWESKAQTCRHYRQEFGGGEALVTEIEYAEIMVSSYLSLKDMNHPEARDVLIDLKKVAPLLYGHLVDWRSYRLKSSMFRRGRWIEGGPGYTIEQGQDAFVHDINANRKDKNLNPRGGGEFQGSSCIPSVYNHRRRALYLPGSRITFQKWGRRRSTQNRMNQDLNKCLASWRDTKIKPQLNFLQRRVNGVMRAIFNIVGSEQGSYRIMKQKYSDGRCRGRSSPSEAQCFNAALQAMNMKASTLIRGFKVGSWGHVPRGCSVQSGGGGDFAVHYNRASTNVKGRGYSSVCARR
jgi:hypothetical protein